MESPPAPKESGDAAIERLEVHAYKIPTDAPEMDGTFAWKSTTLVVVQALAQGQRATGYTYADISTAQFIEAHLAKVVVGQNAMNVAALWLAMVRAIRNLGRPGVTSMAIAAVDTALWDLKARLLGLPLVTLWGAVRPSITAYGSGGFTSYSIERLQEQLRGWIEQGFSRVKMKIGSDPPSDIDRVSAARKAVGPEAELFVDANGAYGRKQALRFAEAFQDLGVTWFEEPVSSDDLNGLRDIRERAPSGMEISAGEYGYDLFYFRRMIEARAIDVLQADASRCGGFTELARIAALCDAHHVPLSTHTAPSLHRHAGCALPAVRHAEYFHDHARIESMFFDGAAEPREGGALWPDLSRPGLGLELKSSDVEKYRLYGRRN